MRKFGERVMGKNGRWIVSVRGWERGSSIPWARIVMEDALGRELYSSEIVHHKNGDRADDRLENLVLHSRASHVKEHPLVSADESNHRLSLYERGWSDCAIARHFGVTPGAIWHWRRANGIPTSTTALEAKR